MGEERDALPLFRGDDWRHDEESEHRFQLFLEKYPQSTYAPYARLALGRFQLVIGQYDYAIAVLEELLKTTPDFPLSLEVQHDIARANYLKGIKAFQDVISKYPNWVGSRRAELVLLRGHSP